MTRLMFAATLLLMHGQPANALLVWNWSYSGGGVSASGTFTTNDAPDGAGFYQIVGISGTDNGATITGLQPTGTAIPGNEPYAVDNLVSAVEPRLTTHGFGFSLSNGNNANPFDNGSSYYEYLYVNIGGLGGVYAGERDELLSCQASNVAGNGGAISATLASSKSAELLYEPSELTPAR